MAAMTAKRHPPKDPPANEPKRKPVPEQVPRIEVELTAAARNAPKCGGKLRRLGDDVTEEPEYLPGRFIVSRIVRPRMACSCRDCFTRAPLPTRPIARASGRPGPDLPAHGLVNK
jgi:transposase